MKALPLIWKFPEKFPHHIVISGSFHTEMNFIGMLTGHKCRGSGYAEILQESDLVTKGCLKNVLSGKAFEKVCLTSKSTNEAS